MANYIFFAIVFYMCDIFINKNKKLNNKKNGKTITIT